jgi:hypothetical protein
MVYPLYEYSGELVKKHQKNQEKTELTMEYLAGTASRVLRDKEITSNPFAD